MNVKRIDTLGKQILKLTGALLDGEIEKGHIDTSQKDSTMEHTRNVLERMKRLAELHSAKRRYELRDNIGKAKYSVSFHDGRKTHSDGSLFWDLKIFHNKRKRDQFVKELVGDGYKERSS